MIKRVCICMYCDKCSYNCVPQCCLSQLYFPDPNPLGLKIELVELSWAQVFRLAVRSSQKSWLCFNVNETQPRNSCVFCKKVHSKYFEIVARPAYWCPGCTSCNFDSTAPEVIKPISYIHFASLGYF